MGRGVEVAVSHVPGEPTGGRELLRFFKRPGLDSKKGGKYDNFSKTHEAVGIGLARFLLSLVRVVVMKEREGVHLNLGSFPPYTVPSAVGLIIMVR